MRFLQNMNDDVKKRFKEIRAHAVKSIDKSGKMETVDPTKKNQSEFMRVDKHGDFVTNFLSNFWRQLKDPTKFALFKVSADEAVEKAKEFQNFCANEWQDRVGQAQWGKVNQFCQQL
jgi:hypothetical protein